MTSATFYDRDGRESFLEEMYELPKVEPKQKLAFISAKETEITESIISRGGVVKSIASEPISKRRYKRRKAKEVKRLARRYNIEI